MKNLGSTDFLMKFHTLFALAVLAGAGPAWAGGSALLVNVTIATNRADGADLVYDAPPGPSQGGGLCITNSAVTVRNSIIADSAKGGEVRGTSPMPVTTCAPTALRISPRPAVSTAPTRCLPR